MLRARIEVLIRAKPRAKQLQKTAEQEESKMLLQIAEGANCTTSSQAKPTAHSDTTQKSATWLNMQASHAGVSTKASNSDP